MATPPPHPEILHLVQYSFPFACSEAIELVTEVVKLLQPGGAKEDFEVDESVSIQSGGGTNAPPPVKKTTSASDWMPVVVVPFLQTTTNTAPSTHQHHHHHHHHQQQHKDHSSSWTRASIELHGCLLPKGKIETHFGLSKRSFVVELATVLETPWVLEQLLWCRENTVKALDLLNQHHPTNEENNLISLCNHLDEILTCFTHAINVLVVPDTLGFPHAFRPFNGFSPPLSKEFLLEFSVHRNCLMAHSFRLTISPFNPATDRDVIGAPYIVIPDPWFKQHPNRMVGMFVMLDGNRKAKIEEHHTVEIQVATFTKVLALLQEARLTISVVRDNLQSILAMMTTGDDITTTTTTPLVQPKVDAYEWFAGGRLFI